MSIAPLLTWGACHGAVSDGGGRTGGGSSQTCRAWWSRCRRWASSWDRSGSWTDCSSALRHKVRSKLMDNLNLTDPLGPVKLKVRTLCLWLIKLIDVWDPLHAVTHDENWGWKFQKCKIKVFMIDCLPPTIIRPIWESFISFSLWFACAKVSPSCSSC